MIYLASIEALQPLYDLCGTAHEIKAFTAEARAEAAKLIGDALTTDREAVAQIEAALKILGAS